MFNKWYFYIIVVILLCFIVFIVFPDKAFVLSGLIVGILGFCATIYNIQKGNNIRRAEFIESLCEVFERPNIRTLYYKIEYNKLPPISDGSEDEKDLDELISFFDSMDYYHRIKIISDDEVEFVAVELLTVFENKNVREYIKRVQEHFGKYQHDIIPSTGFQDLAERLSKPRFKVYK